MIQIVSDVGYRRTGRHIMVFHVQIRGRALKIVNLFKMLIELLSYAYILHMYMKLLSFTLNEKHFVFSGNIFITKTLKWIHVYNIINKVMNIIKN